MDLPCLRLDFTDAPLSPDDPRRRIVEVPKIPTSEKAQSIRDEFLTATGSVGDTMCRLTIASSYPLQDIFKRDIAYARRELKEGRIINAFGVAVAVFINMQDLRYWVAATDRPKNVHSIMNAFYKLWLELFRHDDAALGLRGRDVLLEELTTYGNEIRVHGNHTYHFFKPTK